MRLQQLAALAGAQFVGEDVEFTGLAFDSRTVRPGEVFVAVSTPTRDAHQFVAHARERGAVAALVTRPVDGPHLLVDDVQAALGRAARAHLAHLRHGDLQVVAITGSMGKTTTKDMVGQLLAQVGPTVAPVGSFNNEYGLPATVLRASADTAFLVLEMGANAPGDLTYLTGIAPPDIAVVLAVGSAHTAGFGGLAATAAAKAELVKGLAPGGVAILNSDDPRVAAMASLAGTVRTFGLAGAHVSAQEVELDSGGRVCFELVIDGQNLGPVTSAFVGEHNAYNLLAALAVAHTLGLDNLSARANKLVPVSEHRMDLVTREDGVTIMDDSYNANPDSVRAALRTLATLARASGRRSVAILGEMLELGPESVKAHDLIGRLAVRLDIGLLVVVGAGAAAIATGAQHEGSWGDEVHFARDVNAAAEFMQAALRPGDIVLVKSSRDAGLSRLADQLKDTA